jgi:aspartate/methionine/tyrosine aminotransferase
MTASDRASASGFVPPPYPYDRLDGLRAEAVARFGEPGPGSGSDGAGGIVDCSIGTPCDPPPDTAVAAMGASGAERGYPYSTGSPAYRRAAARYLSRRFEVEVDADREVAACVGTKEFVASAAHYLHLRDPGRDTVLYPATSYPTYAMGAQLGGCRAVAVEELDGGGLDLASVGEEDAARALLLWANSPSNPTGHLTDLDATAGWGRTRGIPVFSDECYAEFTWAGPPRTILSSGARGVVAVHSLSKRSNLAGVRAGFFAGDSELVGYLLDVRRHAGLMVPGPVQAGAVVALDDDAHVEVQRDRYRRRLEFLSEVLRRAGVDGGLPEGGFYLWVPVPDAGGAGDAAGVDGWAFAAVLAREAGLLVSPGGLYGPGGDGFVRIAVVQPMERLALVEERLASSGSRLGTLLDAARAAGRG